MNTPKVVLLSFAAAALGWGAAQISIDVADARPLSAAVDRLERMYGVPINYEDPPYENEAELQDVATPEEKSLRPGYRLIVPKIRRFAVELPVSLEGGAGIQEVAPLLNLLVQAYRNNQMPGDYIVEQGNNQLYLTPTRVLGAGNSIRKVASPMTALVTVPNATRPVADAVHAIFDEVERATGQKIAIGTFPFWPTDTVTFGASREPARDALARLFALCGRPSLSYRLTFDPKPDRMRIFDYMMNIQPTGSGSPR